MRPEALLIVVAVVVLVATVAVAVVVPGFVAEPEPDEPPARLDVAETTLETGAVTGETVTFDVTAYVTHHGGPAENVTVAVRAIYRDSGLIADSNERSLDRIENDGERAVSVPVTVAREGGYTIRTILYVDGARTDMAEATVSGVEALTPPHAETAVEFQQFSQQPSVEYSIQSVADGQVTLDVTSYLTNTGDQPESDLRLVLTVRHADAHVVADRASVDVGTLDPGRTQATDHSVTVPNESNYYLDVTLWRDDVVLDSTRAPANLDPTQTIDVDERTEAVTFEAQEFETGMTDRSRPVEDEDVDSQPGFGIVAVAIALCLAVGITRWWNR